MQNIESSYAKYRKLLRFTPNIPPKINFSNYSLVDVYLPPPTVIEIYCCTLVVENMPVLGAN